MADEQLVGWNSRLPGNSGPSILYVVLWAHALMAIALAIVGSSPSNALSGRPRCRARPGRSTRGLGDALGRALGDSSLTLLAWSPTREQYLDERGNPAALPVDVPNRAVTRIERQGEPLAVLIHDSALLEDPGLVNAVVAAVRLTIDNEQLQAAIEKQLAEVAASRSRIMAAGDAERRRIERDLHDGAQQRLVTIALALRLAESRVRRLRSAKSRPCSRRPSKRSARQSTSCAILPTAFIRRSSASPVSQLHSSRWSTDHPCP